MEVADALKLLDQILGGKIIGCYANAPRHPICGQDAVTLVRIEFSLDHNLVESLLHTLRYQAEGGGNHNIPEWFGILMTRTWTTPTARYTSLVVRVRS